MPFCINCNQEIINGAKFCPECGTPVKEIQGSGQEQRKQVFAGEIRKCPNCGGPLSAFDVTCQTCGFEIRNAAASTAIQRLENEIAKLEANRIAYEREKNSLIGLFKKKESINPIDSSIANIIRSFAVPNTKEDILEFMMLAASSIEIDVLDDNQNESKSRKVVAEAWVSKFEQCYQKAKIAFGRNADFNEIKDFYDKKKKEIHRGRSKKSNDFIDMSLCVFLLISLFLLFNFRLGNQEKSHQEKEQKLEAIVVEIQDCIAKGDYDSAYVKAQGLHMDDNWSKESREKWDEMRKELIAIIESKSGVSYSSKETESSKQTTSSTSVGDENQSGYGDIIDETKQIFNESAKTVTDAFSEAFTNVFD